MSIEGHQRFCKLLESLNKFAPQWSQPLVDVIDTASHVRTGIQQWLLDEEPSDELVIGLTRLVLERETELRKREIEGSSVEA
jgi:hypothetical protein